MGRRIQSLTLDGFRGFRAEREIDVDADLVVLVGPNGSGKTSVVEALELAVTGRVLDRFETAGKKGAASAMGGQSLVNQRRDETAARVVLQLANGAEPRVVTLDATDEWASGAWCDDSDAWRDDDRRRFLRGSLFFYADGLRSQLGLEPATEQMLLDLLTPGAGGVERASVEEVRRRGDEVISALRAAALADPGTAAQQLGERAHEFEQAWMSACSVQLDPLTTAARRLRQTGAARRLTRAIDNEFEFDDSDVPSSDDERIPTLLRVVARAAEEKQQHIIDAADGVGEDAGPSPGEVVLQLLGGLPDPCPTLARVRSRLQERASSTYQEQIVTSNSEIQRLETAQQALIGDLPSSVAPDFAPHGLPSYRVGAIPALATLALWRRGTEIPHAEPFTATLRETTPADVERLFEQAVEQFRATDEEIRGQRALQARLMDEEQQQERDVQLLTRLEQLHQLWAQLDEAPVPERDGQLDLDRLRAAARAAHGEAPASVDPGKWQRLAEAATAFQQAHDHWQDQKQRFEDDKAHADRIAEVESFLDWMATLGRGGKGDPLQRARRELLRDRFDRELAPTFRGVLTRFTHTQELRHARLGLSDDGSLQLSLRDANAGGESLLGLSASQRQSIAVALALTSNLHTPEMPFDFICLDDVADSFDLHNIAADASILRHLAYGGGDRASAHESGQSEVAATRQVIVTLHNEDTAERLTPLLLPPGGRSLRVIEFKPYDQARGIDFRVWTARGDQAHGRDADASRLGLRQLLSTADEK